MVFSALTGKRNYNLRRYESYSFLRRFSPSPKYPQTCVCPKPYTVCNGHCGPSKACPSSVYYKRSVTGNQHLQCPKGMTACPIIGRPNSWECVDTESDLESCKCFFLSNLVPPLFKSVEIGGGCMVSSILTPLADGVDCTAIQGISDASCFRGQCVVHQCVPGYEPNALEDSCIEAPANVLFTTHDNF